jgi:translation initiation factor 4A
LPFTCGLHLNVKSPSGTGKTATYAIGILQRLELSINALQAIVLCPTRELSYGVNCVIEHLGMVFYISLYVFYISLKIIKHLRMHFDVE